MMLTKKPEINTILQATPDPHSLPAAMATEDLHVYYGDNHAIKGVDLTFPENKVTALIGPSGCGKSTYLRALNRMNDEIDGCRMEGQILYDGININRKEVDLYNVRKEIGMVFQKPNPFTKSIYENVAFGLKRHGMKNKKEIMERVEKSLRRAALWDEVKDDLGKAHYPFLVGSNNVFVLLELSQCSQKYCYLMSQHLHLIQFRQAKLKI